MQRRIAILECLAGDEDEYVRRDVARNPNTPIAILERLAEFKDEHVRCYVAGNPNTPISVLERLAEDKDKDVRKAVAENPNTPLATLESLVMDRSDEVHSAALRGKNVPSTESMLDNWSRSKRSEVRVRVVNNAAASDSLLALLVKDRSVSVRQAFIERFDLIPSPALMLELAADPDPWIRAQLASCPDMPPEGLRILARADGRGGPLASQIANNPATPIDLVLERYERTGYPAFLRSAIEQASGDTFAARLAHICADPATRLRLPGGVESKDRTHALTEAGERKTASVARVLALLHPECPTKILAQAAKSKSWIDRCTVAQNPAAPKEVLERLRGDADRNVAAAAGEMEITQA